MARPKLKKNRDLEPHVRCDSNGYYSYKHPKMSKRISFKKDKDLANAVARATNIELNQYRDVIKEAISTAVKSTRRPASNYTFGQVVDRFIAEYVPTLSWSDNTEKNNKIRLRKLCSVAGPLPINDFDVLSVNELMTDNFKGDGVRVVRSLLKQVWTFAIAKGLFSGANLPDQTLKIAHAKRKRHRIDTYQDFLKIREHASDMVKDAMDLGIITLQARNEICKMKVKDHKRDVLRVIRQKTAKEHHLKNGKDRGASEKVHKAYIEMSVGEELMGVLHRCKVKAMSLGSPYMVNHLSRSPSKVKTHRAQVLPDYLTKQFRKAVKASGLYDHLDPTERPTFHEVRSLGGRLYKASGEQSEFVQNLYAHTKLEMTEKYLDNDKIVWSKAKASMSFALAQTLDLDGIEDVFEEEDED